MKLVADSKDYSSDKRALGFTLLICFAVPLMFAPLYLLVAPAALGFPAQAALALLLGGLALLSFVFIFLKGKGIIFKVPMRVFDEGVLLQPLIGLRPRVLQYADVSSIELFYGAGGKVGSGCTAICKDGTRVRSVEHFNDKESLKSFTERIRPVLEQGGFRLIDSQEGGVSVRFSFRRPLSLQVSRL